MNNLVPKKTCKLFYKEYAYKVCTRVRWAYYLRTWSLTQLIAWCQDGSGANPDSAGRSLYHLQYTNNKPTQQDREELLKFCILLNKFANNECKFRFERSNCSIFVKDKILYGQLALELQEYVVELWEPENDQVLEALLSNKKTIICNEYPYGIYRYKVTLGTSSKRDGASLLEWIDRYPADKVLVSKGSRKYLAENHPYYDPWVYVADEKMIMMLNFATSGSVRRCEEFVLRSSLDTQ